MKRERSRRRAPLLAALTGLCSTLTFGHGYSYTCAEEEFNARQTLKARNGNAPIESMPMDRFSFSPSGSGLCPEGLADRTVGTCRADVEGKFFDRFYMPTPLEEVGIVDAILVKSCKHVLVVRRSDG